MVCPFLLNQECSYCHKKRTHPKQCPELQPRTLALLSTSASRGPARALTDGFCCQGPSGPPWLQQDYRQVSDADLRSNQKQGAFDALISESDSDEDVEEKVQEDFPAIGNAPTKVAPVTTGWASVAAAAPKPAPIKAKMPDPVAPQGSTRQLSLV